MKRGWREGALSSPRTDDAPARPGPQNLKERLYERIKIPLRVLDGIIVLLFAAILLFIIIGMIEGRQ